MRRKYNLFAITLFLIVITSCSIQKDTFDEQAHRGGRGLIPENTIPAMKNAIDYDCTLEMDLEMSKDKKIVVSHDAYFKSSFCLTPEGNTMTKEEGRSRLLYNMPYDSIAKYDVGMKPHPNFPQQKKMHAIKPLLSVLIDSVEAYAQRKNHVNHYNIELKGNSKYTGIHFPTLQEYVDSAMAVIIRKGIAARTTIQSFDETALKRVHKKWPNIKVSYLVGAGQKDSVQGYIKTLGFKPDIFSPNYHLVTAERVKKFHEKGIKVIPWTPNTVEEMQKLKDMGVDGLITDYPNLYAQLKNSP